MKRAIILLMITALGACGFEPMYGQGYQGQDVRGELAAIEVDTPEGVLGELLRAEIEDGVNPEYQQAVPRYKLSVELLEEEVPLFINPDGTSERGEMRYTSHYVLTRLADNRIIHKGKLQRVGSYNSARGASYAAYISKEDAKKRAIVELAQDYKLRLSNLSGALGAGGI